MKRVMDFVCNHHFGIEETREFTKNQVTALSPVLCLSQDKMSRVRVRGLLLVWLRAD